jgi:uncharacterized protein
MIFTAFVFTVFTIVVGWLLEYGIPYMPISPFRKLETVKPSDFGLRFKPLLVRGARAVILRGYFIHALTVKARATIIILHGIGSAKEVYFDFARWLAEQGFNVVVYDQRAHGRSGGKYCTFGFYEKRDVSRVITKVLKKHSKLPIGIHGTSMGGAVALQTLAIEKRLSFGIIESTFNTLENVIEEYSVDMLKFRSRWLVRRILSRSAKIAQFRPFDIQPVESCRHIEQPILLIHGDADEKIPITFNLDNFNALKTTDKEFYIVKGARHEDVREVGGAAYEQKMLEFLNRCVH